MCLLSDHSVDQDNVNIVVLEKSQYLRVLLLREPLMSPFLMNLSECERRDADSKRPAFGGPENMVCDVLTIDIFDDFPFQPSDEDG